MHHLHTVFIVGSSPTVTTKQHRSGREVHCTGLQIRKTVSSNLTSYSNFWPISSVVEHRLDKAGVDGSFPSLATKFRSQSVHGRTQHCHCWRRGSLPLGTAKWCISNVMAAWQSPKLFVGVRVPGGVPSLSGYNVMVTYNFAKVDLRVRFSLPAPV